MTLQRVRRRFEAMDKKRLARYSRAALFGEKQTDTVCGERLTTLFYRGSGGLIVTVHGGGFASNCVYDEDAYCEYLRRTTGFNVASLDYMLSYKRGYPLQLNQCDAQIKRLAAETLRQGEKLVLVGHSAGANLAAALTLKAMREQSYAVAANVLNYPALDSYKEARQRKRYWFTLSDRLMTQFSDLYAPRGEARKDALVSPLFMTDVEAAHMPPTLLVRARGDKLAEDADAYYEKLTKSGVSVKMIAARAPHGFIEGQMRKVFSQKTSAAVRYAKQVTDESIAWLQETLAIETAKTVN